ncbi:MAG: ankyrin repeat domain-containing protein, partial [Pseudomonadota bacterium]
GVSTPLHIAAHVARKRTVEQFIAAGADVDAAGGEGATPFLLAALFDRPQIAQALAAAGADVNAADNRKRTALHFAVRQRNPRMARVLLDHGADMTRKDDLGQTPAQIIRALEDEKMRELIGSSPANRRPSVSKRDEICFTILLMNYPGSPDYHESSFNGRLHEARQWSRGAFGILKDALTHLAERWADRPLPRKIAYPALEVYDAIQFSVACHWHKNDAYKIENIDAEELLDGLDELRNIVTALIGGNERLDDPPVTGDLKAL